MDETYIKMCDCPEIQGLAGQYCDGSDFAISRDKDVGWLAPDTRITEDDIWLPRQDQLQGMLDGDWKDVFERFAEWVGGNPFNYTHEEMSPYELYATLFTSMEQLWLAFTMKELHNKVWNDKWV